jgi:hypothetical protein
MPGMDPEADRLRNLIKQIHLNLTQLLEDAKIALGTNAVVFKNVGKLLYLLEVSLFFLSCRCGWYFLSVLIVFLVCVDCTYGKRRFPSSSEVGRLN